MGRRDLLRGQDPGEQEAKCGVPFSGHCGQRLRSLLEEYRQSGLPRQQSGTDAERFFWLNTVLFNPKHNQAWSQEVRIARQLTLLQLMHEQWGGCELVTLGKEAFFWFGIGQPDEIRGKLRAFWHQGDMKYERNIEVPLPGLARTVCLYPLPHPSKKNARWRARFLELLKQRLLLLLPGEPHLRLSAAGW